MDQSIIVSILIFIVAISMTMVGKGGGNFYVVILAMAGISMHEAATTGQFILFAASITAMVIFQKNKSVSCSLAVLIGSTASIAALCGGYLSHLFSGFVLKLVFAFMLFASGAVMLIPVKKDSVGTPKKQFGTIEITSGGWMYGINWWKICPKNKAKASEKAVCLYKLAGSCLYGGKRISCLSVFYFNHVVH